MKRYYISPDEKLCLYWTPKCGCSTATEIFFKYIGYDYSKYNWIHDARVYYEPTQPKKIPENSIKVQIVRNPYDRAISGFCDLMINKYKSIENFKKDLLKWYEIKLPFNNNQEITKLMYKFFQYFIYANKLEIAEKKLNATTFDYLVSHLSTRQYMTNNLDFVIKLETLESDLDSFNKKFNFSLENCKYDVHSIKKRFGKDLYMDVYSHIYSFDKNKKIIQLTYKKDFEYFNYDL